MTQDQILQFKNGDRVFVSEAFLRRRFPRWRVPYVEWHLGYVTRGYKPGDMITIPQHAVNVNVSDLQPGDVLVPMDPFAQSSKAEVRS